MMGWLLLLLGFLFLTSSTILFLQVNSNKKSRQLIGHLNDRIERLQQNFGPFAPQEVIEHLTDSNAEYHASRRSVTVLFADLAGFTALCDRLEPEKVVSILNGYFNQMTAVINRHHGVVTEITGDGMLALFGALESNPWQEIDSVEAAIAMRSALKNYNAKLAELDVEPLAFGIGIHHGSLLAGVFGSRDIKRFSVVGDAINVASRIEGLTRFHDVDILVSSSIASKVENRFSLEAMPSSQIKGKSEPITTYFVVDKK